jgi:hypothetical protein
MQGINPGKVVIGRRKKNRKDSHINKRKLIISSSFSFIVKLRWNIGS